MMSRFRALREFTVFICWKLDFCCILLFLWCVLNQVGWPDFQKIHQMPPFQIVWFSLPLKKMLPILGIFSNTRVLKIWDSLIKFGTQRATTWLDCRGHNFAENCQTRTFIRDDFSSFLLLTVFENYQKCLIWIFRFWHFPLIFVLLKLTCLVSLFDRKLQVFKNRQNRPFLAF